MQVLEFGAYLIWLGVLGASGAVFVRAYRTAATGLHRVLAITVWAMLLLGVASGVGREWTGLILIALTFAVLIAITAIGRQSAVRRRAA